MIAIIGLGNPTEEYANTRHNAGFNTIDVLAERLGANYWKSECGAVVAHCKAPQIIEDEILLAKPQSFMNVSGGPVKSLCDKYGLSADNLIVIHDDMDIQPGNIRVKKGGSSAGHNGLKSISNKISTNDYVRVRAGIGRPPGRMPVVDYVLSKPKGKQADEFAAACETAADASEFLLTHTVAQAQQEFNSKQIPKKS